MSPVRTALAVLALLLVPTGCAAAAAPELDLAAFVPTAANPDPSTAIDGVEVSRQVGGLHVGPDQRVAYTAVPPTGGAHDQAWAACDGVVYPQPLRTENLVHSLEHGAVWIAYDPARVDSDGVERLAARVEGQPYTVMSPYPGLPAPVSVQAWGHRLALDDPADPRIDAFVAALRSNANTHPEPGASCDEIGRGYFDRTSPPPFAPAPGRSDIDGRTVVAES